MRTTPCASSTTTSARKRCCGDNAAVSAYVVQQDDPTRDDVRALLEAHLGFAHSQSPPEDVYALNAEALAAEDITLFSIREDGHARAVGALRRLDEEHAEIKSMHTAAAARGRGLGKAMLEHLLQVARDRGYQRVSLETGTPEAFEPARRIYEAAGFERCEPFGDYKASPYSVCMTLELG